MLQGYAANLQAPMLDKESSGDYSAINQLGYVGGYQFGASALETLGYLKSGSSSAGNKSAMNNPANWTGKSGVSSLQDFLQNTDVQDAAFQENVDFNLKSLKQRGTVDASTSDDKIMGLLAASHLLGAGGASNDLSGTDANGTSGQDYYNIGFAAYTPTNGSTNDAVEQFFSSRITGVTQSNPTPAGAQDDAVAQFFTKRLVAPAAKPAPAPAPMQAPVDSATAVMNAAYNTSSPNDAVMAQAYNTGFDGPITGANVGSVITTPLDPLPSDDLVTTFRRGVTSGAEGVAADLNYMGAAWSALFGDEQGVADSIENARIQEEFAGIPLAGMKKFSEVLDEPTFEGVLDQITVGVGQLVPSVISAITGAGIGSVTMLAGKQVLTQSTRQAAKSIIKDSLNATAKKTATPDQRAIAQAAFEATKEAHVLTRNRYLRNKTAKQGALLGAGLSEYAPLTGSNVSEALESGRELDRTQAMRAGLVALPQAAIGVFGEAGLLSLISRQASKKSAGPKSVMGRLAAATGTGFVKGGVLEGAAELAQEELAIRNRMDMDATFTDADANLRRIQAGFIGFFGGAAAGGGGSGLVQAANEIPGGVVSTVAAVTEKAAEMSDSIKEFMTRSQASSEISRIAPGQTTQESKRDIDAQVNAMIDPSSSKEAVWISGTTPDPRYASGSGRIKKVIINGSRAYSAFVPGRGTIISTDVDIVENVIKGEASDAVLAAALGYSSVKTGTESDVFRVYDAEGGIISEQVVSRDGDEIIAARAAAEKLMPKGGRIEFMPVEDALADRARRAEPDVKFMDDDVDPLEQDQTPNERDADQEFEPEVRTHSFTQGGKTTETYQAVEGDNSFDGIEAARAAYADMLGFAVDFTTNFYKRMSKSMLNTAVSLQKANPDEVVQVAINSDGSYRIDIETTPDTQKIRIRDKKGIEDEVSMSEFLRRSISKAASSIQKFRTINITAPGADAAISVNPVDLMNAGRRIVESLEGSFTGAGATQSTREGLLAILGELQMRGYEVDIQGVPLSVIMENLANPRIKLDPKIANITVGFNDAGKKVSLGYLLKPYVPGSRGANIVETLLDEETETVEPYDMAENNARTDDGIPLTRGNIEEGERNIDSRQNRPIGSSPSTGPTPSDKPPLDIPSGVTFPFGEVNTLVTSLVKRISRAIKLKTPTAILSLKGIDTKTREIIAGYINNKASAKGKIALRTLMGDSKIKPLDLSDLNAVASFVRGLQTDGLLKPAMDKYVSDVADATLLGHTFLRRVTYETIAPLTNSSPVAETMTDWIMDLRSKALTRKGVSLGFQGASVIILNDVNNTNEAAIAMTAAHEMGHALFREEINGTLKNEPLMKRLTAAFIRDRKKARDDGKPIRQWEEEGFEEWYADQVAAWIKQDMQADDRSAKNAIDSHFKRIAEKFKKLWAAMSTHPSQIFRRTDKVKPSFKKYMDDVTAARAANRESYTAPVYNDNGEIVAWASGIGAARIDAEPANVREEESTVTEDAVEASIPDPAEGSIPEPAEASWEQKALVQAIKAEINIQTGAAARETAFRQKLSEMQSAFLAKNPWATQILGLVRTADGMLRMVAGDEIADLFYVRSNTTAGLGFTQARQLARDEWRAGLFDAIGADWTTDDVQNALEEAQGSTPTSELKNPKAVAIRKYLQRMHEEYVAPSNSDIGFRNDYFPVLLELAEITADPEAFIQLVVDGNKRAGVKTDMQVLRQTVNKLIKYQGNIDEGGKPESTDALDPGAVVEATLDLTKNVERSVLRDTMFLMDPEVALMKYIDNITKRVEWNKATKDANGKDKLQPLLATLNKEEKATAESVINAYLGNVTHLSPFWRKTTSYLATMNLVTLLPFATLASIPDFAGSIVQTKEFKGIGMFFKEIVNQIQNREVAKRLANDIGVVMPEAAATAWMSQADSDMLDPTARNATDKFFKYTGLQALTTLSREFSAGMGKQFLIEHAYYPNERSDRYLAQLGVTAEQVRAWNDSGESFDSEEGQAVKAALSRFVESSVLRPNAGERPIWASDPRFALVWQLKSFIYAFNKVILEGVLREGRERYKEGNSIAASMGPLLILTMAAFMPLAALGLELREYAKVGLSYALPGIDGSLKYLRSDKMDYGTYFVELFSRAGLDGPIGMLTMAQRSGDWGGSALATLLGPTAELADKMLQIGPIDGAYGRMNSPQDQAGILLGIGAVARTVL